MQATDMLRAEHDAVLAVLDQLDRATAAAADGVPVPRDIFADIQEFFSVFVDRCHHAKEEDAVFRPLATEPGGRLLVDRLEAEHEEGRRLTRAYRAAVAAYVPGDAASGRQLAAAAGAYATLLRAHIQEENDELFTAMERRLGGADARIAREFDRIEVEELGAGTHERLHGMIDTLPGRIAPWVNVP